MKATDLKLCTDCGTCADRCSFGARRLIGGSLQYAPERCCGLCVSTCPTEARSGWNREGFEAL